MLKCASYLPFMTDSEGTVQMSWLYKMNLKFTLNETGPMSKLFWAGMTALVGIERNELAANWTKAEDDVAMSFSVPVLMASCRAQNVRLRDFFGYLEVVLPDATFEPGYLSWGVIPKCTRKEDSTNRNVEKCSSEVASKLKSHAVVLPKGNSSSADVFTRVRWKDKNFMIELQVKYSSDGDRVQVHVPTEVEKSLSTEHNPSVLVIFMFPPPLWVQTAAGEAQAVVLKESDVEEVKKKVWG